MLDKEEVVGIDNRIGVVEEHHSSRGAWDLVHEWLPLDAMARRMNDLTRSGRWFLLRFGVRRLLQTPTAHSTEERARRHQ